MQTMYDSVRPPLSGRLHETELPRAAHAGLVARYFIDDQFGSDLAPAVVQDVKLVASELANNAVLHGDGRITLTVALTGDSLRVEVVDEGTGNVPAIREHADRLEAGGRGLQIVDVVSRRWGVFEGTTHVWADIPVG
jgi:anti-sigma regulatory factor (Ser/Thr protein kinase)